MELYQWQPLDSTGNVQMLTYSFGPGTANTMAIRLDDGSFLVVSPATRAPEAALDALGKLGPVSALLAPNAYHHMGQAQWRASMIPTALQLLLMAASMWQTMRTTPSATSVQRAL